MCIKENDPNSPTFRICKVCNTTKELTKNFRFHSADGYYYRTCIECENRKRQLDSPISTGRREGNKFIKQRMCPKCGIIKDIVLFKKRAHDYTKVCIECLDKEIAIRKEEKLNKGYLKDSETRQCTICKEHKNIKEFSFSKSTGYYSSMCKPCDVKRKYEKRKNMSSEEYEVFKEKGRNWHKNNKPTSLLATYRKFDAQKGLDTDLTKEIIKEFLDGSCVYCGYPSTGVDRLNNSIGHIKDNCVSCCWECNTARMNNFSFEEMLVIGKAIKQVKDKRL